MKSFLYTSIITVILNISFIFGYEITPQDQTIINNFQQKVLQIKDKQKYDLIVDYINQIMLKNQNNDRILFILDQFKQYLISTKDLPQNDIYQNFKNEYGKFVTGDNYPQCQKYYTQVDEIAKSKDFPTELVLAMRYREHHCGYDNPANRRGIFQIKSNNYGQGNIDENLFKKEIIDFIDFSKGKISRYNQKKNFGKPINISYNSFDIDSIRIYAYVYRGYKSAYNPWNSAFVNSNFNGQFSSSQDGVLTLFTKFVNQNHK